MLGIFLFEFFEAFWTGKLWSWDWVQRLEGKLNNSNRTAKTVNAKTLTPNSSAAFGNNWFHLWNGRERKMSTKGLSHSVITSWDSIYGTAERSERRSHQIRDQTRCCWSSEHLWFAVLEASSSCLYLQQAQSYSFQWYLGFLFLEDHLLMLVTRTIGNDESSLATI